MHRDHRTISHCSWLHLRMLGRTPRASHQAAAGAASLPCAPGGPPHSVAQPHRRCPQVLLRATVARNSGRVRRAVTYVPALSCLLISYRSWLHEVARDEVVKVLTVTGNSGEALYDGLGALKYRGGHGKHSPMAGKKMPDQVRASIARPGPKAPRSLEASRCKMSPLEAS